MIFSGSKPLHRKSDKGRTESDGCLSTKELCLQQRRKQTKTCLEKYMFISTYRKMKSAVCAYSFTSFFACMCVCGLFPRWYSSLGFETTEARTPSLYLHGVAFDCLKHDVFKLLLLMPYCRGTSYSQKVMNYNIVNRTKGVMHEQLSSGGVINLTSFGLVNDYLFIM